MELQPKNCVALLFCQIEILIRSHNQSINIFIRDIDLPPNSRPETLLVNQAF